MKRHSQRDLLMIVLLFTAAGVLGLINGSGISAILFLAAGVAFAARAVISHYRGGGSPDTHEKPHKPGRSATEQ